MTLSLRRLLVSSPATATALALCVFGCHDPTVIDVDFSDETPRFLIHHRTWGWPVLWPRVNAFAIASDEDGKMWELRSRLPEGVPARDLVFEYGETPTEFRQTFPIHDARPRRFSGGRNYFIGATGPNDERYRMVFGLPMPRGLDDAGFVPGIDLSDVGHPKDDKPGTSPGIDRSQQDSSRP